MPSVDQFVDSRTIARARLVLGALLLFAAVLSWLIGLTLSPHGQTVVAGTEHVRDTVVTFKRNSAIGTLILSTISAWLLFPKQRAKRQAREWLLIVLLTLLAASSIYTLLSLRPAVAGSTTVDENQAIADNSATVPDTRPMNMNAPAPAGPNLFPDHDGVASAARGSNEPVRSTDQGRLPDAPVVEEQGKGFNEGGEDKTTNNAADPD